jgi:IS605 OrfB family transposase
MRLVERHVIKRGDRRFKEIDRAAFAAKNRSNRALYVARQAFCRDGTLPTYPALYRQMKGEPEYPALPRKVAQWVLKQVCVAWDSYDEALAAWEVNPATLLERPRIPHYKHKVQGRNLLVYTAQALSRPALRHPMSCPSGLAIAVQTQQQNVQQVRIIPRTCSGFYVVEVVYARAPVPAVVNPALYAGVDVGLNNLALLTANKVGFVPRLVNGRPVKSVNPFDNKRRAEVQRWLGTAGTSRRLERITTKRTRRIDWYLHAASRRIIELLVAEGIGTRCIGKNPLGKQEVRMGRRTNQNFVQVPHARFIAMLTYKAELVGLQVRITEESYTSQASFLDADPLPVYGAQDIPVFSGRRVKRGLYRAKDGRHINADANGSYNTICKVAPDAFVQGSRGCVVHPVRLAV